MFFLFFECFLKENSIDCRAVYTVGKFFLETRFEYRLIRTGPDVRRFVSFFLTLLRNISRSPPTSLSFLVEDLRRLVLRTIRGKCFHLRHSTARDSIAQRFLVEIMERLSEHDKAVLDVIFDPLKLMGSSFTSHDDKVDPPTFKDIELPDDVAEILDCAIRASKDQRFEESLRFFDEAKTKAPKSAAILNDRAQALRLVGRDEGKM